MLHWSVFYVVLVGVFSTFARCSASLASSSSSDFLKYSHISCGITRREPPALLMLSVVVELISEPLSIGYLLSFAAGQ